MLLARRRRGRRFYEKLLEENVDERSDADASKTSEKEKQRNNEKHDPSETLVAAEIQDKKIGKEHRADEAGNELAFARVFLSRQSLALQHLPDKKGVELIDEIEF